MSSGLFSIARGALMSHQAVLQAISQNIANAETPGYSRQEAVLVANTPVRMSYGNVGTGVHIETVIRKRDILLDETYRTAAGEAGSSTMRRDLLGQVEGIFGEPTDAGMTSALDQFFGAWSDLASNPTSGSSRAVVQQRGRQVAQLFNDYDQGLTQQRSSAINRLQDTVTQINGYANQVADLNNRILSSETNGDTANDLRDQRDLALDGLAKIAGTRVINQANGTVSVLIGNSTLVDGASARPLSLQFETPNPMPAVPPADIPVRIRLGDSPDRLAPLAGQLDTLVDVVNNEIPGLRGRLDAMATSLVTNVNAVHTTGYTFSGNAIPGTAAGNFFDAGTVLAPVSASTIKLDALVAGNAGKIAASGNPNAPADNTTGLALSALRLNENLVSYTTPNGSVETGGYLGFFRSTVTSLGVSVMGATDDATMYQTLTDTADTRRQSVSGVSTDEELVQMLRVQQSYAAATKMIKAADEMLQTLLSLV